MIAYDSQSVLNSEPFCFYYCHRLLQSALNQFIVFIEIFLQIFWQNSYSFPQFSHNFFTFLFRLLLWSHKIHERDILVILIVIKTWHKSGQKRLPSNKFCYRKAADYGIWLNSVGELAFLIFSSFIDRNDTKKALHANPERIIQHSSKGKYLSTNSGPEKHLFFFWRRLNELTSKQ